MVFPSEGSRAPSLGSAYPQYSQQVSPGRAAAAISAAAAIGIAGGSALANEGRTFDNNYQRTTPIERTAPAPSNSGLSPYLQGASGQSAPRIPTMPSTLPSAAEAMPSMGGGAMPPIRGSGLAGAAAALAQAAAEKALGGLGDKNAKGDDPLNRFRREAGRAQEAEAQRKSDEQAAMKDFWGQLGKKWDERGKNQRKGDTFPDAFKPVKGGDLKLDPAKSYYVYWDLISKLGDDTQPPDHRLNGVSGGDGIHFTNNSQEVYLNGNRVASTQGSPYIIKSVSVVNVTQVNGQPVPREEVPPFPTNTDGSPQQVGLLPVPSTPNTPAAPSANQNSPAPAKTASPGSNIPSTGKPATPSAAPSSPGTPTEASKAPQPVASNPGSASPQQMVSPLAMLPGLLPFLPSASPSGSATNSTSTFNSPFTALPGTRATDSLKPIEPPKNEPQETKKPEDPCCTATQGGLEAIKRVLGVTEFPATLPLLTGDENRTINNIPDLLLWNTSNTDAVAGLFPATVRVEQPDSTIKEIKLQNMAHAMEELFAAVLTVAEDADAAVNIGARIATEVVQTKIATHQGNDLLKAMQKFLGFGVIGFPRVIKLNFSPTAAGADGKLQNDEMAGFLKPSTQNYVGTELSEKQEVLPMLQRILRNSEIAMRAVWQPIKPGKHGEDSITGTPLRASKQKPSPAEKKQWEDYLKLLKDSGFEVDDNSPSKGSK